VCPSAAMTGSTISSRVIGQTNSSRNLYPRGTITAILFLGVENRRVSDGATLVVGAEGGTISQTTSMLLLSVSHVNDRYVKGSRFPFVCSFKLGVTAPWLEEGPNGEPFMFFMGCNIELIELSLAVYICIYLYWALA